MLKLNSEHLTPISLLRSDRWLYALLSPDDLTDPWQLGMAALLDYQHYSQRKDDNEMALGLWLNKSAKTKNYSLGFLQDWADKFLLWQGNGIEVKPQYLDEWQSICAYVDPLLILAWQFAEKIKTGDLYPAQLVALNQSAQALQNDAIKDYADNHSHLGGHGSHRKAIVDFAFMPHSVDAKTAGWPTLSEFNHINAGLINTSELPRLHHALFAYLVDAVAFSGGAETEKTAEKTVKTPLPDFVSATGRRYRNDSLQALITLSDSDGGFLSLLQGALQAVKGADTDKACLLLYSGLFYAERYLTTEGANSQEWRSGLRAFIHSSQILRASMIHRGVGLGYFVDFFRHKTRKGNSSKGKGAKAYQGYALGSDIADNVFREFKVSEDMAKAAKLQHLSEALIKRRLADNIHFCLHFTRSGKPDDKWQRVRRLQLQKERNRLVRLFSSFEMQHYRPRPNIDKNGVRQDMAGQPPASANLLNLLRGIDVAGNENELPIEVFAPTLRFLRAGLWKNRYCDYQPPRRPHLSIHAGEDFKHILSGLRHIDETVRFCDMTHDDRLGHALALGIDVTLWAKRQGTVLISAGEHLDNLVWLHQMTTNVVVKLPAILPLLTTLADRIATWSRFVYGSNHSPQDLFAAWQLRRNCPLSYSQDQGKGAGLPGRTALLPDFVATEPAEPVIKLWRHYFMSGQLAGANQVARGNNRYTKTLTIRHLPANHPDARTDACSDDNKRMDYFTLDELAYITAIQDHLMQLYDQKGIIIEACPSSNIYTGHFEHYHEHPLYRWHPPQRDSLVAGQSNNPFGLRTGPVKVCINTDDAGLFPTTIVNEHRVIKETAIKHFAVATEDADSWIERIRQVGLMAFKRSHLPLTSAAE